MIKVIDDGVQITLMGQNKDTLFLWSIAMLICAVVVAVICFTLPVPYAIASLAIWAVLMYFFNQKKHAAKSQKYHTQGLLVLKSHHIIINDMSIKLTKQAQIISENRCLIVRDGGVSHYFEGFDDQREIEVAKAVLGGQRIVKQAKSIKMNATA